MNEPAEPSHQISTGATAPVQPVAPAGQPPHGPESQPESGHAGLPRSDAPDAAEVGAPVVDDGVPRIGRFTLAQLAAMQGRRGRKPPEFHQLFPKTAAPTAEQKPARATGRVARRLRPPAVRISSAMIGEHSIDELIEMVGATGKKPVAYDILRQAAQVFADRGALDLPKAARDPLARQVATAPARIRELITELIRLGQR